MAWWSNLSRHEWLAVIGRDMFVHAEPVGREVRITVEAPEDIHFVVLTAEQKAAIDERKHQGGA